MLEKKQKEVDSSFNITSVCYQIISHYSTFDKDGEKEMEGTDSTGRYIKY